MPRETVNDTTLNYERRGKGSPILILHDGLLDSGAWAAVAEKLAETNEVIAYDRRGYGTSAAPKSEYSNLKDLRALVGALELGPVTLLACSMGGALAVDFALQYPKMVTKLILVGAVINGFPYSDHMNGRNRENWRPLAECGVVKACIRAWSEDPYLINGISGETRGEFYRLLCAHYGNITNDPRLIQDDAVGACARLGEIGVPTLVIAGEGDIPDVHAQAGILEHGIRGARRVIMRDCGHLPYFERPAVFAETIRDFLAAPVA
ncbi:MAG TPA: alpha/beta hydrolase [Treponemataceae bacterium]|nr:alpha/beta hydrolase [Treponemataceae bacterium]HPS44112.1 alpha/beta hydrolase [Treponemataceae bacterium]